MTKITKQVRLDLDPDMHGLLRVVAAKRGQSMSVFVRDLVEKTVLASYRRGTVS
jgi:plasmid stability protein